MPSGEPGAAVVSEPNRPCVSPNEAGGEVHRVGVAAAAAVADLQRPQPVDLDRLAVGVLQLSQEAAGGGVEGVDAAVAEVAHQQDRVVVRALTPAKLGGAMARPHGESSGPREIRRTLPPARPGVPSRLNTSTKPWCWSGHVVVLGGVLLGVGDVDLAVEDLHVERGVALGQVRVGERAGRQRRDGLEGRVVDVDRAGAEVGGVEQRRRCWGRRDDRRARCVAMVRPL